MFAPLQHKSKRSNDVVTARKAVVRSRARPTPLAATTPRFESGEATTAKSALARTKLEISHLATESLPIQTKLEVSEPGDALEQEADRVAESVMRMPLDGVAPERQESARPLAVSSPVVVQRACSSCIDAPNEQENQVQRSKADSLESRAGGVSSHWFERFGAERSSGGEPLPPSVRRFMEPRFGASFEQVQLHRGATADALNRDIDARAFTVGRHVFFKRGEYAPGTERGRQLMAHELAHTLQQEGLHGRVQRQARAPRAAEVPSRDAAPRTEPSPTAPATPRPLGGASLPRPEDCPPPADMACAPAESSPDAVTNVIVFPSGSSTLSSTQKAEIDATAAAWISTGGTVTVRVDGYASPEGKCVDNWRLSCRRARAVCAELATPSDGAPGVPTGKQETFANGESGEAGPTLAPNRRATISVPLPPKPKPPSCPMPVLLGRARGCGSGSDFTHFDFPHLSLLSEVKLVAWAQAHVPPRAARGLVADTECELEMDGVLVGLAGAAGHAAYSHFAAGTGGTVVHGAASSLGAMALRSGSFLATVATVRADIESQLAAQALSGVLNPCALSATPPATHFQFSDGSALKAVIGGTQGERLFATAFTGSVPLRTYSIDLRFVICDDFGVDEADLYAPGLFAFWVLQHERSASRYAPFVNQLELAVNLSGTF